VAGRGQRSQRVAEVTRLFGASGRARSRIKVHDDAVLRLWEQFAERDGGAVGGRQGELGSSRSHLKTRPQDNVHNPMTRADYVAPAASVAACVSSHRR